MASVGCTNSSLDPTHGGSTLPVPDLTKVTFTENALSQVVLTGSDEATLATDVLLITNQRTGYVNQAVTSQTGSFAAQLVGAQIGDTLELMLAEGKARSDPVALDLIYSGTRPPAPTDVVATRSLDVDTMVTLTGRFAADSRALVVRIATVRTGELVEAATTLEIGSRLFHVTLEAAHGEVFWVYGLLPELARAPSPYVMVDID